MNKKDLKSLFNKAVFDSIFTRQRDDKSCTPAAMTTAARLYGVDPAKDYKFFRKELGTGFNGSSIDKIVRASQKHLPLASSGRNTYRGGIALGSIYHKPEGDLHSVVFLARRGDTFVYYDPFDHKIFHDRVRNMMRKKAVSKYDQSWNLWTANLPEIKGADFDFWMKLAEPNPFRLEEQYFRIREKQKLAGKKRRLVKKQAPSPGG